MTLIKDKWEFSDSVSQCNLSDKDIDFTSDNTMHNEETFRPINFESNMTQEEVDKFLHDVFHITLPKDETIK